MTKKRKVTSVCAWVYNLIHVCFVRIMHEFTPEDMLTPYDQAFVSDHRCCD